MMWNIHQEPEDNSINISASGDTVLMPANAAGYNYVFNISIVVANPTTITLRCGAREVARYTLQANATVSISAADYQSGQPYFIARPGEAFVLNSSSAVGITGTIKSAVRLS
jgi:hypothetical protein